MLLKKTKTFILSKFLFTSIRSKILIYFIILILFPISVISVSIYYISTSIITSEINSSLEEKLNIINVGITQKFDSINNIFTHISLDKDFINIMSSQHPDDTTEIINEMSTLNKLLTNYFISPDAQTMIVPKIYIFNRPEYLMYSFTSNVSDFSMIEKEDWYKKLSSNVKYTIIGLSDSANYTTIKIAKKLYGLDDMFIQFSGVLTVDVSTDYFTSILSNSKPTFSSSTFVLDSNNIIIMSSDHSLLGKSMNDEPYMKNIYNTNYMNSGTYIEEINNTNNFIAYEKIDSLNLTIVSLIPMSELNGELILFKRVIYLIVIICMLLAFFLAFLLSNNISSPIRKLVKSMKIVQSGNFDIKTEYNKNDEFLYLFTSFEKMVKKLKESVDKLYVSEVKKKEAELRSLQSQINPHFLYNTLDSINWMALELEASNISTMVTSLSNFFRYSLSKGKDVIPLNDEFKQVESYLKIQKIRFEERLEYTFNYPKEIINYLSVKLILQPIVENSIIHGLNKIYEKGVITITAEKKEADIVILVTDTGIGADVNELNSILAGNSNRASFGIRNVDKRIKHYFGEKYGLQYIPNEGPGITAVLCFPAVKRMEDLNVKDDLS